MREMMLMGPLGADSQLLGEIACAAHIPAESIEAGPAMTLSELEPPSFMPLPRRKPAQDRIDLSRTIEERSSA